MNKTAAFLSVLALPWVAAAQEAVPASSSDDRWRDLNDAQVQQAISVLLERHVEAKGLDEKALRQATLRGLLERLAPGAELAGDKQPASPTEPFRSEVLDGSIGYLRLGSLATENLAQLDAALKDFAAKKVDGVVLDLRATPESQNFELAAQVAERFTPSGVALFELIPAAEQPPKKFTSSGMPLFSGVLVIVVDGETAGAAEALAATLRSHSAAMVVGAPTQGRAVEMVTVSLGGGQNLRLAAAAARVEGQPPLYPGGVTPDLEVAQSAADRRAVLAAALEKGVAVSVLEHERAQLNEAALVAGTNPDLTPAAESPEVLYDRPLQRAVDLVVAIRLFRK